MFSNEKKVISKLNMFIVQTLTFIHKANKKGFSDNI